jgi:hypothetical protein
MQAAKQAGTDKLPPEEANKQLDAAVEQIRSAG